MQDALTIIGAFLIIALFSSGVQIFDNGRPIDQPGAVSESATPSTPSRATEATTLTPAERARLEVRLQALEREAARIRRRLEADDAGE